MNTPIGILHVEVTMKSNTVVTLCVVASLTVGLCFGNCDKKDFYVRIEDEELLGVLVEDALISPPIGLRVDNVTGIANESLESVSNEFLGDSGKVRGSRCLKNVTKCMELGQYHFLPPISPAL